jgi:carbon-monoxide dehydrogenase medium subunit
MIPFELAEPRTIADAVSLLDADDPSVRPIAGGTALMLMMKAGVFHPAKLVSLRKLGDEYRSIRAAGDGLRIGALTPIGALERSADIKQHAPLVAGALPRLSNVRVRNVATVGGALAHGDPHMDLPPVLMALGAKATVIGPSGKREVAIEDLYVGYYETVLAKNELIAEVFVPSQGRRKSAYLKVTTGSADDWPALGIAVVFDAEGGAMKSVRLVAGAATEKVMRLKDAEAILEGKTATDTTLAEAGDAAVADAPLVADIRGSVPYKRELMRVYVKRAVHAALNGSGGR